MYIDYAGDISKLDELDWIELPLHNSEQKVLVDGDYDGEYFSQFVWKLDRGGYVYRTSNQRMLYLHHEVLPVKAGLWRDHINRNKLDNRSRNLRAVTPSESASNRWSKNTKLFKGVREHVSRYKRRDGTINPKIYYIAVLKSKHIGTYESAVEAAVAYNTKAKELWGDIALLNDVGAYSE